MIRCTQVKGRFPAEKVAYVVDYRTDSREGSRHFGGHNAREKATNFAVKILRELLLTNPLPGVYC